MDKDKKTDIRSKYGSDRLNNIQKEYTLKICKSIRNREIKIRSPEGLEEEQFFDCVREVRYQYPEFFYIDFGTINYTEGSNYYVYKPKYIYSEDEVKKKKAEINAAIKKIFLTINAEKASSVYQRCGLIHNYLVSSCTYDDEALNNRDAMPEAWTIEGVFLKNTAVCLGISLAFRLLCSILHIDAIVARGFSLEPGCTEYERHAWNIVCVGDNAAHVDVTWDMCLSKNQSVIRYDYFFLPDLEAMRDHQYVGYPICRQLKSTYFEKTGTQFDSIEELGVYIKRGIAQAEKEQYKKALHFQFKMKNRKETKDEVYDYIRGIIRSSFEHSYTWTAGTNDTQSVFLYSVEFV